MITFSALMLLVEQLKGRPACKKFDAAIPKGSPLGGADVNYN